MERKAKLEKSIDKPEGRTAWRKKSGGTHFHHDGQVVKKGELLYADENELSLTILSKFDRVD